MAQRYDLQDVAVAILTCKHMQAHTSGVPHYEVQPSKGNFNRGIQNNLENIQTPQ